LLSFGGVAVMGLTIPLLNIIVAPAAVIGATLYFNEIKTDD
jgi:CysZ protein